MFYFCSLDSLFPGSTSKPNSETEVSCFEGSWHGFNFRAFWYIKKASTWIDYPAFFNPRNTQLVTQDARGILKQEDKTQTLLKCIAIIYSTLGLKTTWTRGNGRKWLDKYSHPMEHLDWSAGIFFMLVPPRVEAPMLQDGVFPNLSWSGSFAHIWAVYYKSLAWFKAIFGGIPLLNHHLGWLLGGNRVVINCPVTSFFLVSKVMRI